MAFPLFSVCNDRFDFVLFFFDKVRWRLWKVGAIGFSLLIGIRERHGRQGEFTIGPGVLDSR